MQRPTISKPTPRTPSGGKKVQAFLDDWNGEATGEKVIIYADSGMGKTSLALLAPNPAFVGLDDGGRKLRHPVTGERLRRIRLQDSAGNPRDPETFEDIRACARLALDLPCDSVILDTATRLEPIAEEYVLRTVPGPNNSKAVNMESYGYGKGYKHLYDAMSLPLADFDKLVEAGKNVIVLCQAATTNVANPGGDDFLKEDIRLYHDKKWSIRNQWAEWADHVLRIAYQGLFVNKQNAKDKTGKGSGDTTHVIHTVGEVYFRAKSRTLDDPVISFEDKADDSLWQLMFDSEE